MKLIIIYASMMACVVGCTWVTAAYLNSPVGLLSLLIPLLVSVQFSED